MRILFAGGGTGGHLYPGLAIARAVQRLRPDIEPFFVGARRGIEPEVLPGTGYEFALLDLHPLYRTAVWKNWQTAVGLVTAWRAMGAIVRRTRPMLVVGTGGYAAVAALAYATAHAIPFVEQTGDALPSLTARLFSRWAREVYLSFPEAASRLRARSPDALVDTGAPIEPPPQPRPPRAHGLQQWSFSPDAVVVLVSGGSQGSLAVNAAVREWLAAGLPPRVHVVWSTGKKWFGEFAALESARVRVRAFLNPVAEAYAVADVAVARAGSMTLAELLAWHIPAVLVPLPTAADDHQSLNAVALERVGAAIHLPQSELSGASLGAAVASLVDNAPRRNEMARAAAARARPRAAEEIARRVVRLVTSD